MEDFPPSYELATTRDVWAIVSDYIPSADLCAASLVCKRWHAVFVPFLWGAPASHFGTDNDAVYVALTRFRRTLKRARLEVRMLTHTFHLPPALSEIYGGPRPSWLQEVLEYLPKLQSLLVSQLPFFDHNSLMALRPKSNDETSYEAYGLRLLLAQREPNTTSVGIREALLRFPLLVYLDLSFTTPARDHGVFAALSYLKHLQVLKLRGIGMKDADMEVVADSIQTRVRLLDVRNNLLTDASLRPLLQKCFLPPEVEMPSPTERDVKFHFEWARSMSSFSNVLNADSLKSEDFDVHLMKQLMIPLTGRSDPQDLSHVGITHLYISDNRLSVEGLGSLLKSTRLHVLDGGTVKSAGLMWKRKGFEPIIDNESHWVVGVRFPGAEKLIPALRRSAANNLTYLRVHHAVVTEYTSSSSPEVVSPISLLQRSPVELDNLSTQVYELPGDGEAVRHELPDTSFQRPMPGWRSNYGVRAPTRDHEIPEAVPLQPFSLPSSSSSPSVQSRTDRIQWLLERRPKPSKDTALFLHPSQTPHLRTLVLTDVPASVPPSSSYIIYRLIGFITACADEALLATLQARSNYSLPPGCLRASAERQHARTLFSLERIILEITPVAKLDFSKGSASWNLHKHGRGPGSFSKSSTEDVDSENLWVAAENDFSFFSDEAGEECGVRDEDVKGMDGDRDRNQDNASVNSPRTVELDSTPSHHLETNESSQRSPQKHPLHPVPSPFLASPARAPAPLSSPHLLPGVQQQQQQQPPTSPHHEADIDVVAALAAFRKAKKAEYEELLRTERRRKCTMSTTSTTASPARIPTSIPPRSPMSPSPSTYPLYVEGYWKGEVKIVRNPMPKGRTGGVVDLYGNFFEKR
ncbi:hypothetical protein ACO22_02796 [Paracoccidioides brasiliensis]|uniref:F-box domain-containing protein n=1 Tax=Paracoccidioides brasiliensis TaxID=121759 RepID=A0A1D2JHZ0_PARBR|nr:hypothetical protein ACO22_02796 [Paracoccidioides brasiliensis]